MSTSPGHARILFRLEIFALDASLVQHKTQVIIGAIWTGEIYWQAMPHLEWWRNQEMKPSLMHWGFGKIIPFWGWLCIWCAFLHVSWVYFCVCMCACSCALILVCEPTCVGVCIWAYVSWGLVFGFTVYLQRCSCRFLAAKLKGVTAATLPFFHRGERFCSIKAKASALRLVWIAALLLKWSTLHSETSPTSSTFTGLPVCPYIPNFISHLFSRMQGQTHHLDGSCAQVFPVGGWHDDIVLRGGKHRCWWSVRTED